MFTPAAERVAALWPAHLEYLTRLHADGHLAACGPFTDGSGALLILNGSLAAAEQHIDAHAAV